MPQTLDHSLADIPLLLLALWLLVTDLGCKTQGPSLPIPCEVIHTTGRVPMATVVTSQRLEEEAGGRRRGPGGDSWLLHQPSGKTDSGHFPPKHGLMTLEIGLPLL